MRTRQSSLMKIPAMSSGSGRSGLLQRQCACGKVAGPDGECAECKKKRESGPTLQRKSGPAAAPGHSSMEAPPIVHDVLRSPGRPLDSGTRAFMEPRFGYDFGRVRVHADARAAKSAEVVNAQAYTVGNQLVFAAGRYSPHALEGRRLLAHELTHVVQQRGAGASSAVEMVPDTHQSEREAEANSNQVCSGANSAVSAAPPVTGLQRLAGPPITVSPQLIQEMNALLEQYTALSGSGGVTAAEAAEVTTAVAEAEAALATATEVVAAGSTAITIGETTLAASGALAADDVTGIGVADDVAIPFLLLGAAVGFGAGYLLGSSAEEIGVAVQKATDAVRKAVNALKKATTKAQPKPQTQTQTQTQTDTQPKTETDEKKKRRKRPCSNDPTGEPLPIAWPSELPTPAGVSPRTLMRVSQGDLEWEGVERGDAQRLFANELRDYRARNMHLPAGVTCFEADAEANTPLDAHHIHPMYLNGEDATWNLCGLETLKHLKGHARLDNQIPFLPVYEENGICSAYLSRHPAGQTYYIAAEK
jgi:hypothetical protein